MATDGQIREITCPVPHKGLMEGVDAASDAYPATHSPDLQNVRVTGGTWSTRLGMSTFKSLPGSDDVRMLADHYESDGTRIRLAARGTGASGVLYDYVEGVDTGFQTTTGGTSLGGTTHLRFQGTTLNEKFYFTDRAEALRKYEETPASGNQVQAVAQPAAPAVMPGVKARPFKYLDSWNGGGGTPPYGWTESDAADFSFEDSSATDPVPGGGRTNNVLINLGTATGETISEDVSGETLNSRQLFYWIKKTNEKHHVSFELGVNVDGDVLSHSLRPARPNEWQPTFVDVSAIPTVNFKQFRVVNPTTVGNLISRLYLPGRLEGQYRWVYTHYDDDTGRESEPSPISNSGTPLDFSAIGVTGDESTLGAINKSAALTFTSDSGTDATTERIRIYRNGGVPSLTLDSATGREVWCRVGTVFDQSTTLATSPLAGATSFDVASATNLAADDTLVINKGTVTEEFRTILTVVGVTITVTEPLDYNHASGQAVQIAFLDNTANELVDRTLLIDRERDDPPAASMFVRKSPDGRLWLLNFTGKPTGVAISNKPTPDRPTDYEVFPDGVDPLTRGHPTQGWRFEINGDANDEEIMWGDFFHDRMTILTRKNLYVIEAWSQQGWGPGAIRKVASVGCIARDSVMEARGVLYWAADGPQIVRWAGSGEPETISHLRTNVRLNAAPTAHWAKWFSIYHAASEGHYYRLYFVPSGATTATQRLDYNIDNDAWEPVVYNDSTGAARGWAAASVRDGSTDAHELYQASTAGVVYQAETGSTDAGVAIPVRFATPKFPLDYIGLAWHVYLRLDGVDDDATVTARVGGSEYGEVEHSYSADLNDTEDKEVKVPLERDLMGRWISVEVSGSFSNRPAFREVELDWVPWRAARASV